MLFHHIPTLIYQETNAKPKAHPLGSSDPPTYLVAVFPRTLRSLLLHNHFVVKFQLVLRSFRLEKSESSDMRGGGGKGEAHKSICALQSVPRGAYLKSSASSMVAFLLSWSTRHSMRVAWCRSSYTVLNMITSNILSTIHVEH